MELWTVDTWRVRTGAEGEFIALLRDRSVGGTRIFRDLEEPRTYWVPRRWESRRELDDWRRVFIEDSRHLVEEVTMHFMELVEEAQDFGG
jgi:hypothetical protein